MLHPKQVPVEKQGDKLNLSNLTVAELKDIAKENNIDGYSSMKKAELIKFIEESET